MQDRTTVGAGYSGRLWLWPAVTCVSSSCCRLLLSTTGSDTVSSATLCWVFLQGKKSPDCKLLCGGNRVGDKGFYFEPTIFEVYNNSAKVAQEKIFGPVQCVFKWTDLDEMGASDAVLW